MMNRIDGTLGVARAFGDFLYKVRIKYLYIVFILFSAKKHVSV